jgi:hypothetical protein
MHSDLIGKIEKARYYAEEPERFAIDALTARFRGGNNDHSITLAEEHWTCDCIVFQRYATCAHVMGTRRMLARMLSDQAREDVSPTAYSDLISMIEKSRHYAHEPERVSISGIRGRFHGSNNDHSLTYGDATWTCDCTTFRLYQTCAHVMALQKILSRMLPPEALEALGPLSEHHMAGVMS